MVSVVVAGGRTRGARFRFEVVGEGATLTLEGAAPRGFQSGRLTLALGGKRELVDEGERSTVLDEAANVGAAYAALRDDVRRGSSSLPGFELAVRLTRLLTELEASSETGMRRGVEAWPDAT